MNKFLHRSCVVLTALVVAGQIQTASAGVSLDLTRVIYTQGKGQSIKINNKGTEALLVQSWVSSGDGDSLEEEAHVPFIITPLVARVEAENVQQLRINYTGEPLPADRESIFYLNVLEIPKVAAGNQDEGAAVHIAQNTRVKLFHRPAGFSTKDAQAAAQAVIWKIVPGKDNGYSLYVDNPSAYHVSLTGAMVVAGNKEYKVKTQMLAPKATTEFLIKDLATLPADAININYSYVDDFGGVQTRQASLTK